MAQPEGEHRINPAALSLPETGTRPSAGGGELDTDFDKIVPLAAHYDLIKVDNEEALREAFLGIVTVDEHGVARSANPDTHVTTSLVAVRVQDHDATVVPFELTEEGLIMPLPGETGSQIGFFIGHDGATDMSAAIRQGDYPGVPLLTQGSNILQKEILIGIGGIKAEEIDEATWAEQVGLYDTLGFAPSKTRGVFAKSHRTSSHSTEWENQRLVVVPDTMRDLVEHHDAFSVTKDTLQVIAYGTRPYYPKPQFSPDMFSRGFDDFGGGMNSLRTKDLGIGFGSRYNQQATTTGIELTGLTSAFQIKVAPRVK